MMLFHKISILVFFLIFAQDGNPLKWSWDLSDDGNMESLLSIEGVGCSQTDYVNNGISLSNDSRSFTQKMVNHGGGWEGSRLYLLQTNKSQYEAFDLRGKEVVIDVDMSSLPCGSTASLYFVEMPKTGVGLGTDGPSGYCDAHGTGEKACNEMVLWEANQFATQLGIYSCTSTGQFLVSENNTCDASGCTMNPFEFSETFYGPGQSYPIDTSRMFRIITQFVKSDDGNLTEIKRLYLQDGKLVPGPIMNVKGNTYNSITGEYCAASDSSRDALTQLSQSFEEGHVLVFGLRASDTLKGPCPTGGGTSADASVTWSHLKVREIVPDVEQEVKPEFTWRRDGTMVTSLITADKRWRWDGDTYNQAIINYPQQGIISTEIGSGKSRGLQQDFFVQHDGWAHSGGSRVYLLNADNKNYEMFDLRDKELSIDVDISNVPCGFAASMYTVEMPKAGTPGVGASYGSGFCDAHGQGNNEAACNTMEIWQANKESTQLAVKSCNATGQFQVTNEKKCAEVGCYMNHYVADPGFYGPGSTFAVDTTKKFTVVTQFLTDDNKELSEIRRYYIQDGKTILSPTINLTNTGTGTASTFDSLTRAYCAADSGSGSGSDLAGLSRSYAAVAHTSNSTEGTHVLVFSLWTSTESGGLDWLDAGENGRCTPGQETDPNQIASIVWSNLQIRNVEKYPQLKWTRDGENVSSFVTLTAEFRWDEEPYDIKRGIASYEDHAITTSLDKKALTQFFYHMTPHYEYSSGSRVYLLRGDRRAYESFDLRNKELSIDVDASHLPCGFNSVLYTNEMPIAGDANYGAELGTGYCDSQGGAPGNAILGCGTMDLWQANSMATHLALHSCTETGQIQTTNGKSCDEEGCQFNPYMVNKTFYGNGSNFTIDTSRVFTVVTQFLTNNGSNDGELVEVRRLYVQDGIVYPEPTRTAAAIYPSTEDLTTTFDSITPQFCRATHVETTLRDMGQSFSKGHVLTFALWAADTPNGMDWLNSGLYGPCPTNDPETVPPGIGRKYPGTYVTWSNLRVGQIGTTYDKPAASPSSSPSSESNKGAIIGLSVGLGVVVVLAVVVIVVLFVVLPKRGGGGGGGGGGEAGEKAKVLLDS